MDKDQVTSLEIEGMGHIEELSTVIREADRRDRNLHILAIRRIAHIALASCIFLHDIDVAMFTSMI